MQLQVLEDQCDVFGFLILVKWDWFYNFMKPRKATYFHKNLSLELANIFNF